MQTIFLLFYSLLGVFAYFRVLGKPALGYAIFALPISLVLFITPFPRPILSMRTGKSLLLLKHLLLLIHNNSRQTTHAFLLLMYLGIVMLGFVKSIALGTRDFAVGAGELSSVLLISLFMYLLVAHAKQKGTYLSLIKGLKISLFFLMMINVIAVLVGLKNPGTDALYTKPIIAVFGLFGDGIIFPFTLSVRLLSICAGVLIIIGTMDLSANKRFRDYLINCAMIGTGLAILLGHGSRSVFLALFGVFLISITWEKIGQHVCFWLVLVIIFIPVIFTSSDIGNVVEINANKTGLSLSRQTGDIATLSNRKAIWGYVFDEFSSFNWEHLLGFGSYGNITSGVSTEYTTFFEVSYARPETMTTHNSFLQILIDYGYIGLGLFIWIVFSLFALLRDRVQLEAGFNKNKLVGKKLTLVLIYLVVISATEICLTYFSLEVWSLFIFINIYAILSPQEIAS
jgi:hypothetical protein